MRLLRLCGSCLSLVGVHRIGCALIVRRLVFRIPLGALITCVLALTLLELSVGLLSAPGLLGLLDILALFFSDLTLPGFWVCSTPSVDLVVTLRAFALVGAMLGVHKRAGSLNVVLKLVLLVGVVSLPKSSVA